MPGCAEGPNECGRERSPAARYASARESKTARRVDVPMWAVTKVTVKPIVNTIQTSDRDEELHQDTRWQHVEPTPPGGACSRMGFEKAAALGLTHGHHHDDAFTTEFVPSARA